MKIENEADALAALKQNGGALEYVPWSLRSPEICRAAIKQNGGALEYVPWSLRSPEICRAAVEKNGLALEFAPWILLSAEICWAAVKQNAEALEFVPRSLRKEEICRAAGVSLADVPIIEDIHHVVYEAARAQGALDMSLWHSVCGTAHCRAGWVVHLAGEAGAELEQKVGTPSAAALIYQASDPLMAADPDWYQANDDALEDMAHMEHMAGL